MFEPRKWMMVALVGWAGCNSGTAEPDPSLAQALQFESKSEQALKAIEAREAEQHAKEAAAKKAAEERERSELDAAAVLPPQAPKNLGAACDAVVDAYDEFMKRGSERDILTWYDGRREKLGRRRVGCVKQGSTTVAACQAAALRAPLSSLDGQPREEAARKVLEVCAEKFKSSEHPVGA